MTMAVAALPTVGGAGIAVAGQPPTAPTAPVSSATRPTQKLKDLRDTLTALFSSSSAGRAIWGVLVRSVDRGESLYELNERTRLIPASTQKIITLSAAGEALGWDYRYVTELVTAATLEGGRLAGDVVVRGSGDPTLGVRGGRDEDVFVRWAGQMRQAGVREIAGRIVGDDGDWDQGPAGRASGLGAGWSWNDLPFGFAAAGGALQYRENVARIRLEPGSAVGAPVVGAVIHPASGLRLDNRVRTGPPNSKLTLRLSRFPGQTALGVDGSIPLGSTALYRSVSVHNPTVFFVRSLHDALVRDGIRIGGDAVDADDLPADDSTGLQPELRVLVSHRSVPLSELSIDMMKRSQNLPAETLFRTVGTLEGDGSDVASQTAVTAMLESWSIDPDHFTIADGSGLSRYNLLTAEALVAVLERNASNPMTRALFEATLPIAGDDGTLERRMRGTAAASNARGKTGSMSGVQAMSGYVDTRDGETLAFAILANNYQTPASDIQTLIDRAVVHLATFSRDSR
jgi:D-alanyl-D-alanine carboxypeptidase/D-alanyl-D-alanine-endopeptidase (penicillin-binding protein 4)